MPEDTANLIPECEDSAGNLRRLLQDLKSPFGVVPFVGAGLSIPIGLPGWSEFLIRQARTAGILKAVRRRLSEGGFEEAADLISAELGLRAFYDAIEDAFGDHNLDGRPLHGAVRLIPNISDGPVITTNFDHVLERVFAECSKPFEGVVLGAKVDVAGRALLQNRRVLLKLHGDVDDRTERILTFSDYEKYYGKLDKPLPRLLSQILSTRPVLFIGCSLTQDRIVSVLGEIFSEESLVSHYAIVERSRSVRKQRLRARSLSQFGIRPIWYPPRAHQHVERLLNLLLKHKAPMHPTMAQTNDDQRVGVARSVTPSPDDHDVQKPSATAALPIIGVRATSTTSHAPVRKLPPMETRSITHHFSVGGIDALVTVSMYDNGDPAEMFIRISKQGSTLSGLYGSFAIAVSLCLQYGVPLGVIVRRFAHTRFEPSGWTGNPTIPYAKSVVDYIFRWLEQKYAPILTTSSPTSRTRPTERRSVEHDFSVGGHDGRLSLSFFGDGSLCALSVLLNKEAGRINGILECFSQACSLALLYGIPAKALLSQYSHTRFEPSGWTGDAKIPYAKSIIDYIARYTEAKLELVEDRQGDE